MGRLAEIKRILGPTRLRKRFGQNFMIDPNLLSALVRDAGLTRSDVVLEIGTGIGALTGMIAEAAGYVVTVEIDEKLARIAEKRLKAFDNVEIMQANFLGESDTVAPEVEQAVLSHLACKDDTKCAPVVIGNLPYATASPMIAALMRWEVSVRRVVVTVQKEMAERIVAKAGTKEYGRLSVLVQEAADAEILRTIPPECFWPRPAVASAVMRLTPKGIDVEHARGIEMLAAGVFQHRRKTVRNALIEATNLNMSGEDADAFLQKTGVSVSLRADQITPEQFGKMASFFSLPPNHPPC